MIMDQPNKEDNESMDDPADGGALVISEGTMAGDQKGELTKDEKLLLKAMSAQMQEKMKASLDKFRHELRQNSNKLLVE
ncbi:hypothetical protein Bca52824_094215 [Brassica carinata]|uniref:Uncharacterized protein n=1 Tax=Brassica carinata TaxID=52824 RepID=A0A8X7P499_BRACI|nr:hypothetical protein Bca52824_094215 [Brassica carinata]